MTMKLILVAACLTVLTVAEGFVSHFLSDEFIHRVNQRATTWTARRNFPKETPVSELKKLLGVLPSPSRKSDDDVPVVKHYIPKNFKLPKEFDSRIKWNFCPSVSEIRDQGSCGSCWAVSSVEVMTDRHCIHSGGKKNFHYASQDLVSCCWTCGSGCYGGLHTRAFDYWVKYGIVSGGPYNSSLGCYPYEIPSISDEWVTPKCKDECRVGYSESFGDDKQFGKKSYRVSYDEESIMYELLTNGPVAAAFDVYEDFYSYSSGVYEHTYGFKLGAHAVKILGYGIENGTPYWLCANSWNYNWGDQGFFKIRRGSNECGIEDDISAGLPKFN